MRACSMLQLDLSGIIFENNITFKYVVNFSIFFYIFSVNFNWSLQLRLPRLNETLGERRNIYHHEQTVAVFDVNNKNQTIRCEVIEAYETNDKNKLLNNLSSYKINTVEFEEMLMHMKKCDEFGNTHDLDDNYSFWSVISTLKSDYHTFFQSIISGTKWCGRGSIAESYNDLGNFRKLDRCCRGHDLCPVKVMALTNRFNIQNNHSSVSKTHCSCEEIFNKCLKKINTPLSDSIGFMYFNVIRPDCIESQLSSSSNQKISSQKNYILIEK